VFGVHGGPRPGIAHASVFLRVGRVLLLRANEAPDLVHLDTGRREAANHLVVKSRAELPEVHDHLQDRVLGDARNAGGGADAHPVNEAAEDLDSGGVVEAVHE